jgi:outer membrane immunogenic protein
MPLRLTGAAASIVTVLSASFTVTLIASEASADRQRGWTGYDYRPPAAYEPQPSYGRHVRVPRDWWSGFYLGGTIGYGLGTVEVDGNSGNFDFNQRGALYGGYAGYNWRFNTLILGVEGEGKLGHVSGSASAGGITAATDLNWQGSVRGRLGFLATPAVMLYGMAGVTWADFDISGLTTGSGKLNQTFFGAQVGGGAEVKLTEQWSLRLDYTYNALAKERLGPVGFTNNYDPSFHAVQAGITFRF